MKLQLQIGGVIRKIKCNSTPDLQDLCIVLSRKKIQGLRLHVKFPPRNTDSAVLRDVLWNPVTCLPDRQGASEMANMENSTKVDDPPQELSMNIWGQTSWMVMINFTSNLYDFTEEHKGHYTNWASDTFPRKVMDQKSREAPAGTPGAADLRPTQTHPSLP